MWIKLDDQIAHHQKFMAAGPVASWLWVCGQSYCARYLTDGFIPSTCLPALGSVAQPQRHAEVLVRVGLWEKTEGGYRVHDFHDYQPSREEVERTRKVRSQAGREGGKRSAETRASKPEANPKQSASPVASPVLQQHEANVRSKPEAKLNPVPVPVFREGDAGAIEKGFAQLWAVYPNKDRRELAYAEYCGLLGSADDELVLAAKILRDVTTRVKYGWARRERHMVPQLATYLREHQYDDGIEVGPVSSEPKETLYDCRVCHGTHIGPDPRICTKELGPVYRCGECQGFHQGFNKAICTARKQEVA